MTEASRVRLEIAKRVVDAHRFIPGFAAAYLTGSAAEGIADDHSDIDMGLFFEEFPAADDILVAKNALDIKEPKWVIGSMDGPEVMFSLDIDGIEVQYGLGPVSAMNGYVDQIVAGELGVQPHIKIAIGTSFAIALHGAELVDDWKRRFTEYPEGYRRSAMEAYLQLRPLDVLYGKIADRNSEIWLRRELSERTYAMFAALAALNRVWFSEFQLKRTDVWCDRLIIAPSSLGHRSRQVAELPLDKAIPLGIALFGEANVLVQEALDTDYRSFS